MTKKPRPKTCHIWHDDLWVRVQIQPDTSRYVLCYATTFKKLFGWLPGTTPVEVRLDLVHRRKATGEKGQFKADRKAKKP